jgi:hypothetical protein
MRMGILGSRLTVDCAWKFRERSAKLWYLEGAPEPNLVETANQFPTSVVAPGVMS